jgi:L-iditol 2-dehydrogenase
MKVKAAVLNSARNIQFSEDEIPDRLDPGEVLIETKSVGICGSDLHFYLYGELGDIKLGNPLILGHEVSGIVKDIGSQDLALSVGDRVALEPGIPCMTCTICRKGMYHLCPSVRFMAAPPHDGALVTHLVWPAEFCFKLPSNVTLEEGAIVEPLAVAVSACQRAGVTLGSRVLVAGAGPIGYLVAQVAFASGALEVWVMDRRSDRLKLVTSVCQAKEVHITDIKKAPHIEELADIEIAIDCTGDPDVVGWLSDQLGPRGTLAIVGSRGATCVPIPMLAFVLKELDVKGVFRYSNVFDLSVEMISCGLVDVKSLITHRMSFDETKEAFELAGDPKSGAMKIMVNFS